MDKVIIDDVVELGMVGVKITAIYTGTVALLMAAGIKSVIATPVAAALGGCYVAKKLWDIKISNTALPSNLL